MLIVGVDPGLNTTGYAVLACHGRTLTLREAGVIRSTKGCSLATRLTEIGRGIREILADCAADGHEPHAIAIEQVFSHTSFPKTAILMAHARGAILFAASEAGIPIVHYMPRQIKSLLTGSGKASKEQVQRAVQMELGLAAILEPNDVADAAAIAVCHAFASRITNPIP